LRMAPLKQCKEALPLGPRKGGEASGKEGELLLQEGSPFNPGGWGKEEVLKREGGSERRGKKNNVWSRERNDDLVSAGGGRIAPPLKGGSKKEEKSTPSMETKIHVPLKTAREQTSTLRKKKRGGGCLKGNCFLKKKGQSLAHDAREERQGRRGSCKKGKGGVDGKGGKKEFAPLKKKKTSSGPQQRGGREKVRRCASKGKKKKKRLRWERGRGKKLRTWS